MPEKKEKKKPDLGGVLEVLNVFGNNFSVDNQIALMEVKMKIFLA